MRSILPNQSKAPSRLKNFSSDVVGIAEQRAVSTVLLRN
jgi:hypothetical protein